MNSLLSKVFYCCALIGYIQAGNTLIVRGNMRIGTGGVTVDGRRVDTQENINSHGTSRIRGRVAVRASAHLSILAIPVPSIFRVNQSVSVVGGSINNNSSVSLDIGNCIGYITFFGGCLCGLRKILNKEYISAGISIAAPVTFWAGYYMWNQRQRNHEIVLPQGDV